jgi:hypothetical protein
MDAKHRRRANEALTGVPIAMISTGPDRDETILVHHPFGATDKSETLLLSGEASLESLAKPVDSR